MPSKFPCLGQLIYNATYPCSNGFLPSFIKLRSHNTQDQLCGSYSTQIFMKKWWHRVYFFFLDTTLTNAFIMHKHVCNMRGLKTLDHKSFQLEVAHSFIACQSRRPIHAVVERSRGSSQSEGISSEQRSKSMTCDKDVLRETADVILSQESVTSIVTAENPVSNVAAQAVVERTVMYTGRTTCPGRRSGKRGPIGRLCKRTPLRGGTSKQKTEDMVCLSSKSRMRKRCWICKKQTTWICQGCYGIALYSGKVFLQLPFVLVSLNKMWSSVQSGCRWLESLVFQKPLLYTGSVMGL